MFSIGLTFKLKPGCYPEYKKAHDELWPEIAETMSDNEIDMVIYTTKADCSYTHRHRRESIGN